MQPHQPFPEAIFLEKRTSSGLGDSSIESNSELDALSKMVVDKVLEKIKNQQAVNQSHKNHQQAVVPFAEDRLQNNNGQKSICDEKTNAAVTQMRHLLQRERNLVSELQV